MPFPIRFQLLVSTKNGELIRVTIDTESEGLLQTRFLKRVLMKTKYRMFVPELIKKFDRAFFPEYIALGFSDLERVENAKEKVTIMRRKSLDKIFVDDNFRLLEREMSDFGSVAVSKTPNGSKTEQQMLGVARGTDIAKAGFESRLKPSYLLSKDSFKSGPQQMSRREEQKPKLGGFKNGKQAITTAK